MRMPLLIDFLEEAPNGRRYRQGRDLAGKPPDAESAFWGRDPESAGKAPHLSGARGVGRALPVQ
jgi:hypothetical protein